MAQPVILQEDFSGGMKPDIPSTKLPKNAVLRMTDFIPDHNDQPLGLRQGWHRTGQTMATTYAGACAFAPFAAGAQLVGIADTGHTFQQPHTTTLLAPTFRGTSQVPLQPPVFYRNKLYIPSSDGVVTVKSYDGSSNCIPAAGTPPAGILAAVFKDHLILARDATTPNRIWFADGGDATLWDTAEDGQWLDASFPVTGLATIRNMMLVFAEQGVERVRGDIIPGVLGSDMVREPLPIPGCADAASIAVAEDVCYYANAAGVFMSDGITSIDLTEQCDYKRWWAKTLVDYDADWNLAGGYFQGKYIIVAHDGATFKLCTVFDVKRRAAYEFTNVPAAMFSAAPTGHAASFPGGLYMAERNAPFLARASDMFAYVSTFDAPSDYDDDDNGSLKSPRVRTGYFMGKPGNKRIRKVYVHFDLAGSDTIELKTYGDMNSSVASQTHTLNGTSFLGSNFEKVPIGRANREGIAIELESVNFGPNGGGLTVRRLEAEMQPQEASRRKI